MSPSCTDNSSTSGMAEKRIVYLYKKAWINDCQSYFPALFFHVSVIIYSKIINTIVFLTCCITNCIFVSFHLFWVLVTCYSCDLSKQSQIASCTMRESTNLSIHYEIQALTVNSVTKTPTKFKDKSAITMLSLHCFIYSISS